MNALSCLIEEHQIKSIPTGSYKLDQALQTGYRLGTLTEINGSSGAGKTQLCLQLTINCILPEPVGDVGGEVVFISTKRNFCRQRVHQLIDRVCVNKWESSDFFKIKTNRIIFTRQEALKKIYHRHVTNLPELIATIYQLNKFVEKKQTVRLVIVDSFSAFLRDLDPMERIRISYELLHVLHLVATNFGCAVVLTNDLTTQISPSLPFKDSLKPPTLKPALADAFHHRIQQRILLYKSDKVLTVAHVQKSLYFGPSFVKLRITKDGIEDY